MRFPDGFSILKARFILLMNYVVIEWHLRIKEVIDETVIDSRARFMSRTQQCFAIKPGTDGLLDVARQIFCATSEGTCLSLQ
jgi:hypothetical protein